MLAHNGIIILLTLLLALIATIIPMPLSVDAFRPDWVLVVLMYWCLALPSRVNVITAWVIGFMVDVLLGSILGIHAAASAITIFIIAENFQKIRNFSIWQQSIIVGILAGMQHFLTDAVFLSSYLYPVITTVIVWPWALFLLRKIRRHFQIK